MSTKIFGNCDTVIKLSNINFAHFLVLKRFTNVKGLLCDTCHSSRWFVTSENEQKVIIGHCDSCHSVTLFCLQMFEFCPRYPNYCAQLCLYESLFIPWWENKIKMDTSLLRFWFLIVRQKMPKMRFFNFQLDFWKPSH